MQGDKSAFGPTKLGSQTAHPDLDALEEHEDKMAEKAEAELAKNLAKELKSVEDDDSKKKSSDSLDGDDEEDGDEGFGDDIEEDDDDDLGDLGEGDEDDDLGEDEEV